MDIRDKVPLDKGTCPPHYLPHKMPDGDPVVNEQCHTHVALWRRWHHNLFCRVLDCPNYQYMIEQTGKVLQIKKNDQEL